ncbi:uncharacterized protein LOC141596647 isoform X2 [Silene latifolia]|uniref:uncharacterized protein LOC141596647 isoform X2 n=1 Tax=Silene latifolia TaxID=37657 RepID=UPI003D77D8C4
MMDDGRSQDEISKLYSKIFSKVFIEESTMESSFVYYHRESEKQRPLSYFRVDRYPGDDLLLQLCDKDHVPWIKQHVKDSELRHVQDAIKEGVAIHVYWALANPFCLNLKKVSKAVDDFSVYNSAITAAAALVYSLYPQDFLYKLGSRRLLHKQVDDLWSQLSVWGRQGLSVDEVCKLIVHQKIDKDKYSVVTEYDIISLLNDYDNQCCENRFLTPSPLYICYEEEDDKKETDTILLDIKAVVDKIEILDIAKVDDYTRLLIKIFRGDAVTDNEALANIYEPVFAKALETVYTTDFQNSPWLPYLSKDGLSHEDIICSFECSLCMILRNVIAPLERHLPKVLDPFYQLCDSRSLELSPEVCEIIQVAELRRIALGSRFIGLKHLMWAFYECGYGLPVNFWRETNIISDDGDYPPYHVYVASVKLAMLFGEKVVKLQHFVFAILRWKIIGDGDQVTEMEEDFRVYMEALRRQRLQQRVSLKRI